MAWAASDLVTPTACVTRINSNRLVAPPGQHTRTPTPPSPAATDTWHSHPRLLCTARRPRARHAGLLPRSKHLRIKGHHPPSTQHCSRGTWSGPRPKHPQAAARLDRAGVQPSRQVVAASIYGRASPIYRGCYRLLHGGPAGGLTQGAWRGRPEGPAPRARGGTEHGGVGIASVSGGCWCALSQAVWVPLSLAFPGYAARRPSAGRSGSGFGIGPSSSDGGTHETPIPARGDAETNEVVEMSLNCGNLSQTHN